MILKKIGSRSERSAGRTDLFRKIPLDVPPRMNVAGIGLVVVVVFMSACIAGIPNLPRGKICLVQVFLVDELARNRRLIMFGEQWV